jgi:hypothetical protein
VLFEICCGYGWRYIETLTGILLPLIRMHRALLSEERPSSCHLLAKTKYDSGSSTTT